MPSNVDIMAAPCECPFVVVPKFGVNALGGRLQMASSRMMALLGMLAMAGYQNRDKLGELLGGITGGNSNTGMPPGAGSSATPPTSGGGLLNDVRGGLFGGAGGGGGDVGGGLGDLVDQFNKNGQGEVAKSWVERGPNSEVGDNDLGNALGADTIDALTRQAGLTREELLSRLRSVLPTAVDGLTPEGRLPTETEIARWAGR